MKVLLGLGNPGAKYADTRHNVGWLFLDYFGQQFLNGDVDWQDKAKLKSQVAQGVLAGQKLLLVKPQTFMNNSGEAIVAVKQFYGLDWTDFAVIYDDIDLDFGQIRYRDQGSAGTHNGMRSVIDQAGVDLIPRLRIGVESRTEEQKDWPLNEFVLAKFSQMELKRLPEILAQACDLLISSCNLQVD